MMLAFMSLQKSLNKPLQKACIGRTLTQLWDSRAVRAECTLKKKAVTALDQAFNGHSTGILFFLLQTFEIYKQNRF